MTISEETKEILDSFPEFNPEFDQIAKDSLQHYTFYRRKGRNKECFCSYCGEHYIVSESEEYDVFHSKHNDTVECPKCKRETKHIALGRIKHINRYNTYDCRYAFMSHDEKYVYIYCCCFHHEFFWKFLDTPASSITRLNDHLYRLAPGEFKMLTKGYYDGWINEKNPKEPFNFCGYKPYLIHDHDNALTQSHLKYSQFDKFGRLRKIKYLCLYSLYPSMEMFLKLGFPDAVYEWIDENKPHRRVFDWNATKPAAALKLTPQEFKVFQKTNKNNLLTSTILDSYKKLKKHDSKVSFDDVISVLSRYIFLKDFIDIVKLTGKSTRYCLNYLQNQYFLVNGEKIKTPSLSYTMTTYKDYIQAGTKLGYDLKNPVVLLPKDLYTAHDTAIRLVKYEENKEKIEHMKKIDVARREKYEYTDERFIITLPPDMQSIIDEGKALSHCVGGYADRHAEGKTTILFLRKVTEPAVPFYTVEIDGNKIRQYHGFANDRENGYKPLPEVKEFVEKWLEWVEKGSKRPKKKKNTTAA